MRLACSRIFRLWKIISFTDVKGNGSETWHYQTSNLYIGPEISEEIDSTVKSHVEDEPTEENVQERSSDRNNIQDVPGCKIDI